jgi:hypothetical protein
MASLSDSYNVEEIKLAAGYKFMFSSIGQKIIVKAVQYTYIHRFEDRNVYNLGFGDYDPSSLYVTDQTTSNNGDQYKVFRTVLSTVPIFFEYFPYAIISVQGSDSGTQFAENCKKTCMRNCMSACRKANQRIGLYRNYVEKHYDGLTLYYWFLGGFINVNENIVTERYIPGRRYDVILLFKK